MGISVAPPLVNSPFFASTPAKKVWFFHRLLWWKPWWWGWNNGVSFPFFWGGKGYTIWLSKPPKKTHHEFDMLENIIDLILPLSCIFPHKWYCCMCVWHCHQETFLPLNLGLGALWMSWQCWDLWSVSCHATAWSVDKDSQTFKNPQSTWEALSSI